MVSWHAGAVGDCQWSSARGGLAAHVRPWRDILHPERFTRCVLGLGMGRDHFFPRLIHAWFEESGGNECFQAGGLYTRGVAKMMVLCFVCPH